MPLSALKSGTRLERNIPMSDCDASSAKTLGFCLNEEEFS